MENKMSSAKNIEVSTNIFRYEEVHKSLYVSYKKGITSIEPIYGTPQHKITVNTTYTGKVITEFTTSQYQSPYLIYLVGEMVNGIIEDILDITLTLYNKEVVHNPELVIITNEPIVWRPYEKFL